MSNNPFAEPNDSDRTVVRGPGGATPPRMAMTPLSPMVVRSASVVTTPGLMV